MSTLQDGSIHYDALPGDEITSTVTEAIKIARRRNACVQLTFNDIQIVCDSESSIDEIVRDYHRALAGCITPVVGPRTESVLSESQLAADNAVYERLEAIRAESARQSKELANQKKALLVAALSESPEFACLDQQVFDKWREQNQDEYGSRIFSYAVDWARLMQRQIDSGVSVKDCHEYTAREADWDGITGFMHSGAASILKHCWVHGSELEGIE